MTGDCALPARIFFGEPQPHTTMMATPETVASSVLAVLPDDHQSAVARWAAQEAEDIAGERALLRRLLLAWRGAASGRPPIVSDPSGK